MEVDSLPELLPVLSPKTRPIRSKAMTELLNIQTLLLERMMDPETEDGDVASLARSYCLVEERKRILRGVPLPGQLRPDLDPLQLAKAIKRSRSRKPIELAAQGQTFSAPEEVRDEEPTTKTPTTPDAHPTQTKTEKEST